jgi:hypothetical protein
MLSKLKTYITLLAVVAMGVLLTQCHSNSNKGKLVGIWQLRTLDINGTRLQGQSLGNWLWEFNEEGGYLTDVSGVRQKGHYTVKDSTLTLKPIAEQNKPEQVFNITLLDSVEMELVTANEKNRSALHFVKRKNGAVADND